MLFRRTAHPIAAFLSALALGTSALVVGSEEARAEGPVVSTGKGIVGGALLGGEVVTLTMGIIGIQKGWPYFVFGAVGAVGGGIGGYFVEGSAPVEVPLYMLAGGMALVIPAVVVSLNATAYKPPEGFGDDPVDNEPANEPPSPDGTTKRIISKNRAKQRGARWEPPHIPMALFDVYQGKMAVSLPPVDVRPLFSPAERAMFGVERGHEVRVPVLRAMF